MAMSKKDFIALADTLRRTMPDTTAPSRRQWEDDVRAIADTCQSSNPAFKRDRWLGYIAGTNGKNGGTK